MCVCEREIRGEEREERRAASFLRIGPGLFSGLNCVNRAGVGFTPAVRTEGLRLYHEADSGVLSLSLSRRRSRWRRRKGGGVGWVNGGAGRVPGCAPRGRESSILQPHCHIYPDPGATSSSLESLNVPSLSYCGQIWASNAASVYLSPIRDADQLLPNVMYHET